MIADEISEHADNLAAAFSRVNEALMEPLDQNGAGGNGRAESRSSRSHAGGSRGKS
jgi:hypothetical protein